MRYFVGDSEVSHGVRLFINLEGSDFDTEVCEITCDDFGVALRISEWLLYDVGVKDVQIEVVHYVKGHYESKGEE